MNLTVIISYYKALKNLKIILKALNNQSVNNFEVIISEDDLAQDIVQFLKENRDSYRFSILHIYQEEDKGFRKNAMLNRAIMCANNNFLAFIDGDCVPHKHFVKAYLKNSGTGYFLSGRAVLLSQSAAQQLLKTESVENLKLSKLALSKSDKLKDAIYSPHLSLSTQAPGLIGRNWGIHKQHLLDVNGFDTDYIRAGIGEDADIEWRLMANGVKRKSVKNKAIVYHIFHPRVYSQADVDANFKLFDEKKKLNQIKCVRGIVNLEGQ